jgi:hypothetical protein
MDASNPLKVGMTPTFVPERKKYACTSRKVRPPEKGP